ncbi:MAG: carboxypeptidase-like regulatory domain-containing protein [Gemmatimonadota bacterium]
MIDGTRRVTVHWLIASALVVCAAASSASAQASLTGFVRDSAGRPLRGALVTIDSLNRTTLADAKGRYFIGNLPAGTHVFRARVFGYEPVDAELTFTATTVDTLDFELVRFGIVSLDTMRTLADADAKPAERQTRELIKVEQLADGHYENVYEALISVRPTWISGRAVTSPRSGGIVVYLDNNRIGGTDELKNIRLNIVLQIQHFNGVDAQARWGIGHADGVILIETVGATRRNASP